MVHGHYTSKAGSERHVQRDRGSRASSWNLEGVDELVSAGDEVRPCLDARVVKGSDDRMSFVGVRILGYIDECKQQDVKVVLVPCGIEGLRGGHGWICTVDISLAAVATSVTATVNLIIMRNDPLDRAFTASVQGAIKEGNDKQERMLSNLGKIYL